MCDDIRPNGLRAWLPRPWQAQCRIGACEPVSNHAIPYPYRARGVATIGQANLAVRLAGARVWARSDQLAAAEVHVLARGEPADGRWLLAGWAEQAALAARTRYRTQL